MGTLLTIATVGITIAVFGFVVYIGQEEYGIARRGGRGRVRAVLRAVRVTIDSFVMGH